MRHLLPDYIEMRLMDKVDKPIENKPVIEEPQTVSLIQLITQLIALLKSILNAA